MASYLSHSLERTWSRSLASHSAGGRCRHGSWLRRDLWSQSEGVSGGLDKEKQVKIEDEWRSGRRVDGLNLVFI